MKKRKTPDLEKYLEKIFPNDCLCQKQKMNYTKRKWRYRFRPFYGALDCKPSQWNHSRRKYRRYRNEFYFPISENIRGYRYISNFFLPKRRVHYSM